MAWQKTRWPILYWHYSHPGPQWPLLWAVTFVPEWNFDSFCVVVASFSFFFFFCFLSGVCPLCTYADASFDICPTVVKPSQTFFFFPPSPIAVAEGDIWSYLQWRRKRRLSGKQESGEMNALSGHFSLISQLPGCTPKIEKNFIFLVAEPGRSYPCVTGEDVIVLKTCWVYRHSSLYCQGDSCP